MILKMVILFKDGFMLLVYKSLGLREIVNSVQVPLSTGPHDKFGSHELTIITPKTKFLESYWIDLGHMTL